MGTACFAPYAPIHTSCMRSNPSLSPRLPAAAAFSPPPMQNMERDWAGELAGGAAGFELAKADGQARDWEGGRLAPGGGWGAR